MHLHFVFVLGWTLFLKLLLARIVFFIFLYLQWKADRLCCLKVRLLLASSYLEDLLVVFLLIFVCEWCFVCSDEKWLCCTWHCEVTMLVTQNERGARAHEEWGWGEDQVMQCDKINIFRHESLQGIEGEMTNLAAYQD